MFINNQPATVAVLRQLAPHLGTIHAQNESIVHFDAAARQDLLDEYAGIELDDVAAAFAAGSICMNGSRSLNRTNRNACGCWICGSSNRARL